MDEKRLALIRYVAGHYYDLLGLFDMAFAVVIGSAAGWVLVFGFNWALPVVGFGGICAALCITFHYRSRHFGRVQPPQTRLQRLPWLFGIVSTGTMIWDQHHIGSGIPSLFFLFLSASALWRVIAAWPFRMHWLLAFAAQLLASMMFIAVESDARVEEWIATSVCLISIALFVTGALDHRLLVQALDGGLSKREEGETHEPVIR